MKKKRSLGITLFGIFLLILAIICINSFIMKFYYKISLSKDSNLDLSTSQLIGEVSVAVCFIILATGIFKLKKWARVLSLWISWITGILLIVGPGIAISKEAQSFNSYILSIVALSIIFLMLPKVKEQFHREQP